MLAKLELGHRSFITLSVNHRSHSTRCHKTIASYSRRQSFVSITLLAVVCVSAYPDSRSPADNLLRL